MLEEMTVINRGTVRKALVDDLKNETACARFLSHFMMLDEKNQHAARLLNLLKLFMAIEKVEKHCNGR
jgi:hypothetical protein